MAHFTSSTSLWPAARWSSRPRGRGSVAVAAGPWCRCAGRCGGVRDGDRPAGPGGGGDRRRLRRAGRGSADRGLVRGLRVLRRAVLGLVRGDQGHRPAGAGRRVRARLPADRPRPCRPCWISSSGGCRREAGRRGGLAGRGRGGPGRRLRGSSTGWAARTRSGGRTRCGSCWRCAGWTGRPRCSCWATELPRDGAAAGQHPGLFAGAAWHEREAAELFGVEFVGGDQRRLLLARGSPGTPLRKDEVLAARTGMAWPGAKEPGESARPPARRPSPDWCRPGCRTRRCGATGTRRRSRGRIRPRWPSSAAGGRTRRRRP